jgi:hypothetical protein
MLLNQQPVWDVPAVIRAVGTSDIAGPDVHASLRPRFTLMTSVQSQSSYRVVITRELRSRRTNRTLRDEVIWIGSLEPVPTEKELDGAVADDSRPYRADDARF